MKVVILALILVSQNLGGNSLNSSLGASFALGGNFGEQQTQKSSFIPKISPKYKTSTANTRICDSKTADSASQAQNAESSHICHSQSFPCHSERSEESKKSPFVILSGSEISQKNNNRDSSVATLPQNDKIEAENDKNGVRVAESRLDSANQNNSSLRDFATQNRGNPQGFARAVARSNHPPIKKMQKSQGGLPRALALARNDNFLDSSPTAQNDNLGLDSAIPTQKAKSPQDAEFADSATCKDDITGFWLSPRDKVSARTSIIEIFKKDGKYFAYNVAFLDELPPKKDALNQNFALRDREILGSVYAYNLERSGEASYINGRYYDFNRGKIFHLKAKLDCNELILLISADNVGFLGKKKIYKALEKSEAEFYIKTHPTIDFSGVK